MFCFPCILHYLNTSETLKWVECPICLDSVHERQLKAVKWIDASAVVDDDEQGAPPKASSSSMPCTTPSPVILDETIERITEAIGDELHERLKKISNQIQTVYRHIDDNNMLTEKLQKKFQAKALSLENAIEKINLHMEEECHYEISRIAKETAQLKGRIASAKGEFKSLLSSFAENQTTHLSQLLDSMSICY